MSYKLTDYPQSPIPCLLHNLGFVEHYTSQDILYFFCIVIIFLIITRWRC